MFISESDILFKEKNIQRKLKREIELQQFLIFQKKQRLIQSLVFIITYSNK